MVDNAQNPEEIDKLIEVKKPQKYTNYTPAMKNHARFLMETEGVSQVDITKQLGIPTRTLSDWVFKGKWVKGAKKQEYLEFTQKRMMEEAVAQGMDAQSLIKHAIEGITSPSKYDMVINDYGKKVSIKSKDYRTSQKYQEMLYKITGLIGNNSQPIDVTNSGEGTVNVQINLPQFADEEDEQ